MAQMAITTMARRGWCFVRSIRGLEAPLITLADALASVEVISAAYEAMWRDAWVPIDSELSQSLAPI